MWTSFWSWPKRLPWTCQLWEGLHKLTRKSRSLKSIINTEETQLCEEVLIWMVTLQYFVSTTSTKSYDNFVHHSKKHNTVGKNCSVASTIFISHVSINSQDQGQRWNHCTKKYISPQGKCIQGFPITDLKDIHCLKALIWMASLYDFIHRLASAILNSISQHQRKVMLDSFHLKGNSCTKTKIWGLVTNVFKQSIKNTKVNCHLVFRKVVQQLLNGVVVIVLEL